MQTFFLFQNELHQRSIPLATRQLSRIRATASRPNPGRSGRTTRRIYPVRASFECGSNLIPFFFDLVFEEKIKVSGSEESCKLFWIYEYKLVYRKMNCHCCEKNGQSLVGVTRKIVIKIKNNFKCKLG